MTTFNRRDALKLGGAGVAAAALLPGAAHAAPTPSFQHGIASGDPLPHAVILWTRVTPTPESLPGSGNGPSVPVDWQVATDADFTAIVAHGTVSTGPGSDHTVKVDVATLAPDTAYYYRFLLDGASSPVGRTRTAPASGADVAGLKFGVVSCANWEAGYFGAYRHLAARTDLFGVIHLGDYTYEYKAGDFSAGGKIVRQNLPANETITLADYRQRHAAYKTDPDLQALHAAYPWMIVWDDHEIANDMWSDGAQNHDPATEGPFAARKAASRQAYHEWMPVRFAAGDLLYRTLRFGRLTDLVLLDLRSYRSEQTSGVANDDPARTITGDAQMAWLKEKLSESETRWRLVGNSVMVSPVAVGALATRVLGPLGQLLGIPEGGYPINGDQWDGYSADRKELLNHLHDNKITNVVFLTGDIHTSWSNEVPLDAATYPFSPSVATEFVVPSVTSDNIDDILKVPARTVSVAAEGLLSATNRHVRWAELDSHGYGVLDVRRERTRMDWFFLSDRTSRTATSARAAGFETPSGSQRLNRVWF
ncbi:alkaline phosphatase D family protein [Actinocorallia longicatena]|uniref:Alkaline phosphatase D family protein n=1 Tax=Actinocorallia longicatena TaxID=111803 RepID=A0ABP6Q8G3_9ACTN